MTDSLTPLYRRIVLKLGTSTLTEGGARLAPPRLIALAQQLAALHQHGCEVLLVSSGAVAAGRAALNFPTLPRAIPAKQMLAAVGQPRLMALYTQLFGFYNLNVAQILLTRADLTDRRRYLNARNTLSALLHQRVIPIINENDTLATEEIRVGDNDNLSALVASLIDADLLVLLTDQPGLFTADPRSDPNAQLVTRVESAEIPPELWQAAGGSQSGLGTGGMFTKLQAADIARRSGVTVLIAAGTLPDVALNAAFGRAPGTCFAPIVSALESRKRYILAGGGPSGTLYADAGAVRAIQSGSSLLPVGVQRLDGNFERGDSVRILAPDGREVARGLVNYASADLRRICTRKSAEIEALLGHHYGDEVIHRSNLVLM
ncbi:MAG: glutamate 5-kinase [Anaerolineales bacterium]